MATPQDLLNADLNLATLDGVVTSNAVSVNDRLGQSKLTLAEIQRRSEAAVAAAGFYPVAGSFEAGGTITERNQVLQRTTAPAAYFSWGGALPKVVPPSSTVAGTGGEGVTAWTNRNDATLAGALADGTANVKFANGSPSAPSVTFASDTDTGIYRKSANSIGMSTSGVERLNITETGRVGVGTAGETVAAQLHVQQSQLAIGILSRGFYEGSTGAPYVNNDIILCETYNRTLSDSANRSWAISCSNAYHDIPAGVTDSGTRVGCLGWAVSVTGRPGYEHRGTIGELTGVMGTSGFQGAGFSGAEIIEATAVRGVVYADNAGGIIRFARAGVFASDGVVGGSTIEENAAIYARAQRGTVSNYSFYGELGELYNQNVIHSPEKISGGSKYTQSNAPITARVGRNGFEFGFPDGSGYGSNIGATQSLGYPFFAFCAEADATGDTYTTRGKLGTVVYNDLAGSTIYGRLTNANAAGQSVTEDMRHRADGKFAFGKNLMMASAPPATATSAGEVGEVTWDANYFYVCVAANTWKRTALATW